MSDESFFSTIKIKASDYEFSIEKELYIRIVSNKIKAKLFPNPVKDKATLEYYLPTDCKADIYILSSRGKEIFHYIENNTKGDKCNASIDVEGLSSGIYYYQIVATSVLKNEKYWTSGKFIKN